MNSDHVYKVLAIHRQGGVESELEPRGPVSTVLLTTFLCCLVALHLHTRGDQKFHQTL